MHRPQRDVLDHNPDCVLVQFGLNDASCGYTPEEFGKDIEGIIRGIREQTSFEIVLVASVCLETEKANLFVEGYYGQLQKMAALHGLPLAQVHVYWRNKISGGVRFGDLVKADRVNPVSHAYRFMAEAIMELLL